MTAALVGLIQDLGSDVILGSHDDTDEIIRAHWMRLGVGLCEFPETKEAALDANKTNAPVIMGAPNVIRGGSHKKNISARALVDAGLCSALASDYHYASLKQAALELSKTLGLARAWSLVSSQPASVLKLTDRGTLKPGLRADFIVIDSITERIEGTFAQGLPYVSNWNVGA